MSIEHVRDMYATVAYKTDLGRSRGRNSKAIRQEPITNSALRTPMWIAVDACMNAYDLQQISACIASSANLPSWRAS
ncbi:hypothetical protein Efla_002348 [Eimeria flavescens]